MVWLAATSVRQKLCLDTGQTVVRISSLVGVVLQSEEELCLARLSVRGYKIVGR